MLRNVTKSNPYIIAVSTPSEPSDLMDIIMKGPVESLTKEDNPLTKHL